MNLPTWIDIKDVAHRTTRERDHLYQLATVTGQKTSLPSDVRKSETTENWGNL